MTRLLITSDLHLGHNNIHKYRTQFKTAEQHHAYVFEQLVNTIKKRDSIIFLGDVAFTKEWLREITSISCAKKLLICGNHDTERDIKMKDIVEAYDDVMALHSRKGYWFSHCPIHPNEMRGKTGNIHGHLHDKQIGVTFKGVFHRDQRYLNACLEHTGYAPISFEDLVKRGI